MSLKSSNKAEEANLYSLDIEISAEAFEAACQKAFAKLKNRINIPGFRKGKVTRKMAEAFYGKGFLYEDALDLVYPEAVEGEVYVKPDVEIKAYKELKATKKKVEATDEEIEAKLHELVHRNARIIAVEDRAAENGDTTVIDFEGFVDGVAFDGGKGENYELKLGSGSFIPGFEDQIVGHNPGDEFDVNVTFPTEYTPELAGKDAVFKVKLHEIKTEELPEVDDEFAQDAADCDTVDALKKNLADEIKAQKEEQNENEIREQVFEKLIENVVADIPPVMVDSELDNRIRDIDYRLSSQGMSFETYLQYMGMSVEDYREQQREDAEKAVKLRLALEKIVELEALEVTEEDLDKEYEKLAAQYQMEADKIKSIISADSLKKDLSVQKASDFVRENAKVTTARKPRAAKPKTEEADAEAAPAEEASAE